jgi:hypothetical protein
MLVAVLSLTLLVVSPAAYADAGREDESSTPEQTTEVGGSDPPAQAREYPLKLNSLCIAVRCRADIPISPTFAQRPPKQEGDNSRRKWSRMG